MTRNPSLLLSIAIKASLLLVVLTMPITPKWGTYSFCLLGLCALLQFREHNRWTTPPASVLLLMSIYLVRVLGLIWTIDFQYGITSLESESPLLLVPAIFAFLKIDKKMQAYVQDIFILLCLALIVYVLARFIFLAINSEYAILTYLKVHLEQPSTYSVRLLNWNFGHYSFMSLILVYGLILLCFAKKNALTVFIGGYVAASLVFMILTGARAGIALLLLTAGFYALSRHRRFFSARKTILLVALLATSSLFLILWGINKKLYHQNDFVRYQFAAIALNAIKEKPLLGFGTGSNKKIIQDIEVAEKLGFQETMYYGASVNHPHNQYLTELIQFGILGSLPFFAFLIQSFRESIRDRSAARVVLLIIFSLFMLVEAPLNSNKGLIPFAFVFCLLSFAESPRTPEDTSLK